MKTFLENHREYTFVQRGDRSVQAHINDALMNLQYEQYQWEDDVPTEEELFISDLRHNDTPRKRKQDEDYIYPTETLFTTWLSQYANLDEQTPEQTINQYRQTNSQLLRFPFDIDLDIDDLNNLDDLNDIDVLNFNEIETEVIDAPSNNVISFAEYTKLKSK